MLNKDKFIEDKIQEIGSESFPDDEGVKWSITNIKNKEEYSFVESNSMPETAYDKYVFVLKFTAEKIYNIVGCYCWEDNQWGLLFSDYNKADYWEDLFCNN